MLPGQLGDVNESVYAAQVHEGTEVNDGGHDTLADLALLQLVEELGANLRLGLLEEGATRQHYVVAVLVELDDLGFKFLANVGLQVANATHFHEGGRQEATQSDIHDEAALDDLDDGALDRLVLFLKFFDGAPGTLVLSTLLGQHQAAFFVLFGENKGFNGVANFDDFAGVDIMLDRKLT